MARLRYNNAVGQIASSLTLGGTTIDFGATAPPFATLVAPDYIPLVIDPPSGVTPNASFEVVYLTAYTAGQTTGTISRAQEGTSAVAHSAGAVWRCGTTAADAGYLVRNVNSPGNSTAAFTVPDPLTKGQTETLTTLNSATVALTFPAAATGKRFRLGLQQDGTGGRLVTWPTNIKFPSSGAQPTLSTAPNVIDYFEFVCLDGTNWLGLTLATALKKVVAPVLTGTGAATGVTSGGTADLTGIAIPGTAVVGDLLVLCCAMFGAAGGSATPTGWTPASFNGAQSGANDAIVGLYVYTKTCVAGDIGGTVSMGGSLQVLGPAVAVVRSYTCGGIDTSTVRSGVDGGGTSVLQTMNVPWMTSTQASELQLTFFAATNGRGTGDGLTGNVIALAAGGSHQTAASALGTSHATGLALEDFAIAASGAVAGSGTTGAATVNDASNFNIEMAAASILLLPAAG